MQSGRVTLNRELLASLRQQRGISQTRMAEICETERFLISLSTIKRAESSHSVIHRTAKEIARFFSVDLNTLLLPDESSLSLSGRKNLSEPHLLKRQVVLVTLLIHPERQYGDLEAHFAMRQVYFDRIQEQLDDTVSDLIEHDYNCFSIVFGYPQLLEHSLSTANSFANTFLQTWVAHYPKVPIHVFLDADDLLIDLRSAESRFLGPMIKSNERKVRTTPVNTVKASSSILDFLPVDAANRGLLINQNSQKIEHTLSTSGIREYETRVITQTIERAHDGFGHCIFVTGNAGIGKSHLFDRIQNYALSKDLTQYLRISTPSQQSMQRYELANTLGLKLVAMLPVEERAEFSFSIADIPKKMAEDFESQNQWIAEKLLMVIAATNRHSVNVIAIEDLHFADHASLSVLAIVACHIQDMAVILLLNARHSLNEMAQSTQIQTLELWKLPDDEMRLLVNTYSNEDFSEEITQKLLFFSDGNPLVVTELVKSINLQYLQNSSESITVPPNLKASIQYQIDTLVRGLDCLNCAAVYSGPITVAILSGLLDRSPDEIRVDVDYLVSKNIFQSTFNDRKVYFQFSHQLLRKVAYDLILSTHKKAIHQKIIDYLHKNNEINLAPQQWAEHLFACARIEEAVETLLKLSANHKTSHNNLDALEALKRAIQYAQEASIESKALLLNLYIEYGDVSSTVEGWAELTPLEAFQKAKDVSEQIVGKPRLLEILPHLAILYLSSGNIDKSITTAEQALSITDESIAIAGFTRFVLANGYFWQNNFSQVKQVLFPITKIRMTNPDIDQNVARLGAEAVVFEPLLSGLMAADELDTGSLQGLFSTVEKWQETTTNIRTRIYLLNALSWLHLHLQQPEQLIPVAEKFKNLSTEFHYGYYQAVAQQMTDWAYNTARPLPTDETLARLNDQIKHTDATQNDVGTLMAFLMLAEQSMALRAFESSLFCSDTALRIAKRSHSFFYLSRILLCYAEAYGKLTAEPYSTMGFIKTQMAYQAALDHCELRYLTQPFINTVKKMQAFLEDNFPDDSEKKWQIWLEQLPSDQQRLIATMKNNPD